MAFSRTAVTPSELARGRGHGPGRAGLRNSPKFLELNWSRRVHEKSRRARAERGGKRGEAAICL
eukprot:327121-Hanusia_phi.AAC.1